MFVAGCHRSGTSYLSGLLSSVINCSRPSDLDSTVDNPQGYYESTLLRPFNDALLHLSGFSWDRPPLAPVHWTQGQYLSFVIRNKDDFRDYALFTGWVDKDPRLSLTYPIFQHLLLRRVPCIIPVRHPMDVAHSLFLRDGFSLQKSLMIWYLYNRSFSLFASIDNDQVVSYEQLLAGNHTQLERLHAYLKPSAVRLNTDGHLMDQIIASHMKLTKHSLHRNNNSDNQCLGVGEVCPVSALLADYCLDVYQALSDSQFDLKAFRSAFSQVPDWLVDSYDYVLSEGQPSLEYLRLHNVQPSEVLSHLTSDLSSELSEVNPGLVREYSELIASVHQLRKDFAALHDQTGDASNASIDNLLHELEIARQQITAFESSAVWRYTAPLRMIADRLKASVSSAKRFFS